MEDSLRVIDAVLKTDLPGGPCWRRYTHDGYGQHDDGGPFTGWGCGRPWPLLTGERGHYELAAGRDPKPYLRAMEEFANQTQLLPEQSWDMPDLPAAMLFYGEQTGSATPLMWAHAEYIKLLRSTADGHVYDLIPEVAARYLNPARERRLIEVWKPHRHVRSVAAGSLLRVMTEAPFMLHWSSDDWRQVHDTESKSTPIGIEYVDLQVGAADRGTIKFTFLWREGEKWEGRDYAVEIKAPG
jgi:glucoamylase